MQTNNLRIEQVEMIRRLRNSGVSLQHITEAYQVFDRIDKEFGSFGLVKASVSPPSTDNHFNSLNHVATQSSSNVHQMDPTTSDCNRSDRIVNTLFSSPNSNSDHSPLHVQSLLHNHSKVTPIRGGSSNQSSKISVFSTVLKEVADTAKSSFSGRGDGTSVVRNIDDLSEKMQPNSLQCMTSPSHDALMNQNFRTNESTLSSSSLSPFIDACQDVSNNYGNSNTSGFRVSSNAKATETAMKEAGRCMLLSASNEQLKSLIQKCSWSISDFDPRRLTTLFGMSDAEVEKFLCGHVPQEHRLHIADWFVNLLIKTEWFLGDVLRFSKQVMLPKPREASEMDFTPRRERFTFRELHLEVLEAHFKTDHYPSFKEKEMIANECNIKIAMATNCELKEKERVTHINVDHWFRNKRKEMIRRAKLEKMEASSVILQSSVKPQKVLLETLTSDGSVDWQGPYDTMAGSQNLIAFPPNQSNETDCTVIPHENGVNQSSAPPYCDRKYSTFLQASNPIADDESMQIPQRDEFNQDVSKTFSDEMRIEIKSEPVNEEDNNERDASFSFSFSR